MAEGAPLLREYAGKNLHRGFESLSLRQNTEPAFSGGFCFWSSRNAIRRMAASHPAHPCFVPVFESVVPPRRGQLMHIKQAAETLVGYLAFSYRALKVEVTVRDKERG